MDTISHLSLLLFCTITLSVHAKLNLDAADNLAIFSILEDLGVVGELHPPDNLCNTAGISCELRISEDSYVLKETGIVLKSRRLRGFLSKAIGQLSELKELSLPNNYLVDRIPPKIANCRKLEILDVHNNKLSGDVPGELSSLLHLRILDLSSNMFSGDLSFLNYLPNLEKLSLDNNMFTGKVPVSLRSFRNLRILNISGSSFLKDPLPTFKQLKSYKRVPRRYILDELTKSSTNDQTGNRSSGSDSLQAPSSMGTLNSVISAIIFPVLFLFIVIMIKRRRKYPGLMLFSISIKAKELWFLYDDKAVAALQIIGRGGCGEVYKKEIPNGKLKAIAIKKAIQPGKYTEKFTKKDTLYYHKNRQIESEIQTAGKIRHRNILPLLASVSRPTCRYLVYEFMQNGSLQDVMQQVNNGTKKLDWLARHKIAIGVAFGLEYLHMSITPRIVHRDLKPANILLDDNMEALITDFGLAKYVSDTFTHMTTLNVAGTLGYMAPELHQNMKITDKCDIYSFGVLLAILVIGKFPSDEFFQNTAEMSMVRWMRMVMTSDNPKQAINPILVGNGYEQQMLLVLKIACFCTYDNPIDRPTSKDCRVMLTQINL